jgi:formate C-acetyltransferase
VPTTVQTSRPSCRKLVEELKQTKIRHTRVKQERHGWFPIDDHGWVPWDEPVAFENLSNHPAGGTHGARTCGANFRRWLNAIPVHIDPASSLAGAWTNPSGLLYIGWKPEDLPTHLAPLHKKYNVIFTGIGAMNHLGPDMTIGLELGWGGLLAKIRRFRAANRPTDTGFYDGEEDVVLGVQEWMRKHVEKARAMAGAEPDPWRRENLEQIADMNEWLVDNPPRTLREACQFLAWFQSIDRMWAFGGALGQLDELLRPFYEADRAAGIVDDEAVVWHLASLFVNDTHYSQVGGPAFDGHDLTSPVSFLVLEAAHRLRIPTNLAVRVHERLDPALLTKSVVHLLEDGSGPSYSCAKGLDEGYAKNGVPIALARQRAKVGCNWTALPGIEYCLQDVTRLCLVAPFLHAFRELAVDAGAPRTLDELWRRYREHLAISVDVVKRGFDWHMRHQAANNPEIVLNLFCRGPIERGLDVVEGGVDIYNLTMDGVGLATVADSLAAIEQRVFAERRLTMDRLAEVLAADYEGAEDVRLLMRNIPRFGCGGTRADAWAKRVSELWTGLVAGNPTPEGWNVIPGLFSHEAVTVIGKDLGATPNGRRAGTPISHGPNPDPGFMADGTSVPTAKSLAVAAVQPGRGNSAPLQMEIDASLLGAEGGGEIVESLIKAHERQGGTLININVISREKILEAYADPTKYPDLVVRVTGFSTFFSILPPESRKWIVDRLLQQDAVTRPALPRAG